MLYVVIIYWTTFLIYIIINDGGIQQWHHQWSSLLCVSPLLHETGVYFEIAITF